MRYILAVSISTQVFKKPKLEFRLNSRLLDEYPIIEDYHFTYKEFKKNDFFKLWGAPTLWPNKLYTILLPSKWIVFEIDDKDLLDHNNLDIIFKNFVTNNTNGFITKYDLCTVYDIIFLPKKFFGVPKITKIFDHCTSRNIMTYFSCGEDLRYNLGSVRGWPVYSVLARNEQIQGQGEGLYFHIQDNALIFRSTPNANRSYVIVWDENLQLHRIQDFDFATGVPLDHTPLKDFYKNFVEENKQASNTVYDPQMHGPIPLKELQPNLVPNDKTTLLAIHGQSIINIQRLANKYTQ